MNTLEKSILHWQRLVDCRTFDEVEAEGVGGEECALCNVYFKKVCKRCPVQIAGFYGCEGSPYDAVVIYLSKIFCNEVDFSYKKWRKLATKELEFLKSLRK